jgi:4-hydroxybenzoate polyprenyltransferase
MRSRFVAYVTLPHFTPLTIVVVVTGLLAWMIDGSSLSGAELGRLLLAMLGGQLLVGITNELIDSDADRLSKPSKPIPAGLVSRRGAVLFGAAGLILMLVAGSSFGALSFSILLIGTGTGIAYSLWFKRSPFAWLPYLIALPLLPIWVAVSLDRFDPALLLLYPLGALAVLGVQLAQSIPDIDADRAAGSAGVTSRLGESRALWLCW